MARRRIERRQLRQDDGWFESIAVSSEGFVEQVKIELGSEHNIAKFWWRTLLPVLRQCQIMPFAWQTSLETTDT
jgi:hypothetical protein